MHNRGLVTLPGRVLVQQRQLIPQGVHKWLWPGIMFSHPREQRDQVGMDVRLHCVLDALCNPLRKKNSTFFSEMIAHSISPLPFDMNPPYGATFGSCISPLRIHPQEVTYQEKLSLNCFCTNHFFGKLIHDLHISWMV